ncbi:MAG TPA: nitroreductase family protein [Clostridium sp.]
MNIMDTNRVLEVIKSRRSVRAYKQEQISQKELDLIIEAGVYAPTAQNNQPWHFTIIQDKEMLNYINKKSKELMATADSEMARKASSNPKYQPTYDAPTLIVVSCKKDSNFGHEDCAAATQNMLIAAESMNIGSVWLGIVGMLFQKEEEAPKLRLPEGYEALYGVVFGYSAREGKQIALKRNMDVVTYIK